MLTQPVILTSTPERQVIAPPETTGNDNSLGLILGLVACVFVPGMLGLAGIVLLAGVWYMRRPQPAGSPAEAGLPGRRSRRCTGPAPRLPAAQTCRPTPSG